MTITMISFRISGGAVTIMNPLFVPPPPMERIVVKSVWNCKERMRRRDIFWPFSILLLLRLLLFDSSLSLRPRSMTLLFYSMIYAQIHLSVHDLKLWLLL
jgi:hypothetical protein